MALARLKVCSFLLCILAFSTNAYAQEDFDINRIFLGTAPCKIHSGSTAPEGAVTGNVCDTYLRTSTGKIYTKQSGTGNTGWVVTGSLDGAVSAPIVQATAAVIRQQASGASTYTSDWFVDGTTGSTHIDAYQTGGGYEDLLFRANRVGSHPYTLGSVGWSVTTAGAADFRALTADEMHVKSFVADLEQALAGSQIIAKSVALVAVDFVIPAAAGTGTLRVHDLPSAANMAAFQANDIVRLRVFNRAGGALMVADAYGTVTSYADQADGTQTWTFTRLSGADAGTLSTGATITADSVVIDYGVSGSGYYEVQAADGTYGASSPYAQVVTWSGSSPIPANQTVRARFGKLSALTGVADEFGFLVGPSVYTFPLRYLRASNSIFELHGIDLSIWHGTTETIKLSHSVPSLAVGLPVPTAYASGSVGFWVGNDSGTYKLRIGDPAGNRLTWDGSTLSVIGNGSGITSISGGNITTGSITASQIAAGAITASLISVSELSAITANLGTVTINTTGSLSSGATDYGTGVGYWLDYNGGSPRFRIGEPGGSRLDWDGGNIQIFTDGLEISDADGISFVGTSGDTDWARSIRWDNGSLIQGRTDINSLHLRSGGSTFSQINLYEGCCIEFWGGTTVGGNSMFLDQSALAPGNTGSLDLGYPSLRWGSVYISGTFLSTSSTPITLDNSNFQGSTQFLCVDSNGVVFASATACA